ncbi:MAG TPA: dTMP kinase [archaeon]|nr:dTMP kinase [archaeon]
MSLFIVIEGCDGAGVGTQSEILREKLMAKDNLLFLRYPDYNDPTGMMINDFLHEKVKLSKEILFCLYALNQLKDKGKIGGSLERGRVVLADRYFTANLAYQCAHGFDLQKALQFADIFEMPKPDLVIFLKVSSDVAIERKMKEKGSADVYERDLELQRKVNEMYEKMIKEGVFAKEWVVVDGEKSIEEVSKEIERIVFSKLEESMD